MLNINPKALQYGSSKNGTHRCPDCGTGMAEVDRLIENGMLYVWYECTREGCDGQRLEKEHAK